MNMNVWNHSVAVKGLNVEGLKDGRERREEEARGER